MLLLVLVAVGSVTGAHGGAWEPEPQGTAATPGSARGAKSSAAQAAPGRAEPASTEGAATDAMAPRPIRLVWEAGTAPLTPEAFLESVMMRLPPSSFAPVTGPSDDAWVILVRQPEPGVYHLEVAPPGRKPQARKVIVRDRLDGRRRLALLAAYALEHGEFPPVEAEGDVEEAVPTLPEPHGTSLDGPPVGSAEAPPRRPPEPAAKAASPPQAPAVVLRGPPVEFHVRAAAMLSLVHPAIGADRPPVGAGAAMDLGLRVAGLAWTGATGAVAVHPAGALRIVGGAGGVFAGVRPRWRWFELGARVVVEGGALEAYYEGEAIRRGFVAGALGVDLAIVPRRGRGVGVFVGGSVRLASRSSTFETEDRIAGFGRVRGTVTVGLSWHARPRARRGRSGHR